MICVLLFSERMMAAKNPLSLTDRPHQLFADAPPPQQPPAPAGSVVPPPPPPVQQMAPGQAPGKILLSHISVQSKILSHLIL